MKAGQALFLLPEAGAKPADDGGGKMNGGSDPRHENRRRRYLNLMGVQPYYARFVFENAKPSPVYPAAPEQEPKAEPGPLADDAPPPAPRGQSARSPQPGSLDQSARIPQQAPLDQSARIPQPAPPDRSARAPRPAPTLEPSPVIERQPLHYRRIDESLALLTQDAWASEDGADSRKLLTNILKALGKSLVAADETQTETQAETVIPQPQSARGEAGQGATLDALCRRDRCPNLLIFAHDCQELFPAVSSTTADFAYRIGGVPMRVTMTRGLREMLAYPDLKQYCWRDLQPLRARLGSRSVSPAPGQAPRSRD